MEGGSAEEAHDCRKQAQILNFSDCRKGVIDSTVVVNHGGGHRKLEIKGSRSILAVGRWVLIVVVAREPQKREGMACIK